MANLGTARGAIEIGTEGLNKVIGLTRQVGQQVKQNLGVIDAAAKSAELRLAGISKNIGKMKGELTGLGVGAGILTGLGLATAGSIQETRIQLKGMLGSQAAANKLMAQLKTEAAAAGVPFGDMLQASRQLLPSLQGNTKELNTWLGLVRRVATLNPREGITGAAFGINEAMVSGGTDLVSLAERFNISRKSIQMELEKNGGDLAAALDVVLNKMGVTQDTAEEMGQTFNASLRAAKDAALQAAGAGFTPLMESITPILQATADWFTQLQAGNPEVLKWGAGIAAVATVGAPTLLLLNNLIEAGLKLKQLGVLGAVGRAGVYGAAAYGGFQVGQAINTATGQKPVTADSVSDMFKQLAFITNYTMGRILVNLETGMARGTNAFVTAMAGILDAVASFERRLSQVLPAGMGGGGLGENADILSTAARDLRDWGAGQIDAAASKESNFIEYMKTYAAQVQRATLPSGASGGSFGTNGGVVSSEKQVNDKIIDLKLAWAAGVQQIESQANAARLAATAQYEQQRSQTIAQYEKSIARDAEDFAISRARAAQQLADQIADVASEAPGGRQIGRPILMSRSPKYKKRVTIVWLSWRQTIKRAANGRPKPTRIIYLRQPGALMRWPWQLSRNAMRARRQTRPRITRSESPKSGKIYKKV